MYNSVVDSQALLSQQGLPQGDPGAPIFMTLLVFALKLKVEQRSGVAESIYHPVNMDDRTIIAEDEATLLHLQELWKQETSEYKLLENEDKAQFVNYNEQGSAFEVLGVVIGTPNDAQEAETRMRKRFESTLLLHKKISMLPQGLSQKAKDYSYFCRPSLAYGWIDKEPKENDLRKMDTSLWRTIGKTRYANPHMRGVIAGANNCFRMVTTMGQITLLAQRNQALRAENEDIQPCQLDNFVAKNLQKLGWSLIRGRYRHPLYQEGFRIDELTEEAKWRCVSHHLRESYRAKEFEMYRMSARHEVVQDQIAHYDSDRRKMAMDWVGSNNSALMHLMGGVQSPLLKHKLRGINQKCSKCGEPNPSWDHHWICHVGMKPPEDCLLRRNLWPRTKKDFPLCSRFLEGLSSTKLN